MQMIESIGPDVILLDIVFPESTTGGFEAAHTIKARYPHLPIIAFSAVSREYALAFTRDQIEADEFLSKPVHAEALVEIIRRRVS
jgi:CheY-like chemotaxis protein